MIFRVTFSLRALRVLVVLRWRIQFPDEKWLDLRRLDLVAPIMLERLDIMQAKGCDAVEWDNADLPVHTVGLTCVRFSPIRCIVEPSKHYYQECAVSNLPPSGSMFRRCSSVFASRIRFARTLKL